MLSTNNETESVSKMNLTAKESIRSFELSAQIIGVDERVWYQDKLAGFYTPQKVFSSVGGLITPRLIMPEWCIWTDATESTTPHFEITHEAAVGLTPAQLHVYLNRLQADDRKHAWPKRDLPGATTMASEYEYYDHENSRPSDGHVVTRIGKTAFQVSAADSDNDAVLVLTMVYSQHTVAREISEPVQFDLVLQEAA